jgi:hypothetical protein
MDKFVYMVQLVYMYMILFDMKKQCIHFRSGRAQSWRLSSCPIVYPFHPLLVMSGDRLLLILSIRVWCSLIGNVSSLLLNLKVCQATFVEKVVVACQSDLIG